MKLPESQLRTFDVDTAGETSRDNMGITIPQNMNLQPTNSGFLLNQSMISLGMNLSQADFLPQGNLNKHE